MARHFDSSTQMEYDLRLENERKEKELKAKKIWMYISIGFFAIGAIFLCIGIYQYFSKKTIADNARQEALNFNQTEYAEARASLSDNTVTNVVEIDAIINNATDAGESLAQIQNNLSDRMNSSTKGQIWDASGHAQGLDAETTQLITDARAMLVDNDRSMQAVRDVWCQYGTWQFENTYDFKGSSLAGVVWTCWRTRDDGRDVLLATVVGTYDADLNKFRDMNMTRTTWYSYYANMQAQDANATHDTDTNTDDSVVSENDAISDNEAVSDNESAADQNATIE